jgi:ketosteroid isomerase-like protein
MNSSFTKGIIAWTLAMFSMSSCVTRELKQITAMDTGQITNEVKQIFDSLIHYSESAQLDHFLSCYDSASTFAHFSSDGSMRNYKEFKTICAEYYNALKAQKLTTTQEKIQVMDENLVVLGWRGNIVAQFKNGDVMNMNNYAITSVLKKMEDKWKIIHAHESALPPEIIKNTAR